MLGNYIRGVFKKKLNQIMLENKIREYFFILTKSDHTYELHQRVIFYFFKADHI